MRDARVAEALGSLWSNSIWLSLPREDGLLKNRNTRIRGREEERDVGRGAGVRQDVRAHQKTLKTIQTTVKSDHQQFGDFAPFKYFIDQIYLVCYNIVTDKCPTNFLYISLNLWPIASS